MKKISLALIASLFISTGYASTHSSGEERITFLDIMKGLNALSESYADYSNQVLEQSSKNMYYPPLTINNRPKKKTVNAQQVGDTVYFSDGTSWTISGDNILHSDGSISHMSNGYIYNSDGSKCYVSNSTLICD